MRMGNMFSNPPPEVISDHIFSFLSVNDLLRLRRVCKLSKDLAENYLRVYGTSERVVRINLDQVSDDLTTFLALPFTAPVTRFDLCNINNSSWDSEQMRLFLDLYGEKITHLKISRLAIPIKSRAAIQFFEALPNLNALWIFDLQENCHDDSLPESDSDAEEEKEEEEAEFVPAGLNLPSTFKRLKHLHLENSWCGPELLFVFMNECSTNLERANYPRPRDSSRILDPDEAFEWARRIVDTRHQQNPDEPNLKYVDLARFRDYRNATRRFYELVTTCSAPNVKLQNVDAELIEKMIKLDTPDRGLHEHKMSRCVMSIRNLTTSMFHLELPFLEKIEIDRTSYCSMPVDFEAQPWSSLKQLKLYVDFEDLDTNGDGERVPVSRLLEFFFHGIRRENLESLDLSFYSSPHLTLPYPNMTDVCSSCPNLKTLYISGWRGTDRDIAQLWGSLSLLEDVTFFACAIVGDAAFIGDDVTRPAICKAKRLKSLKLGGLNVMRGITDALFTSALRHMPLKALYLESEWSLVYSVTLAGLESLLTGQFALTIEKFSLKGKVQLEGVTDEQLTDLERKFRSSQMKCGRI